MQAGQESTQARTVRNRTRHRHNGQATVRVGCSEQHALRFHAHHFAWFEIGHKDRLFTNERIWFKEFRYAGEYLPNSKITQID